MKFIPNPRFEYEFLRSLEAKEMVEDTTEAIAQRAKEIAPRDSGDYADGIKAEDGKVIGTDWKSHLIEWGTIKTPPFAPLRRAAEQIVGTENVRAAPKGGE
jgi:hypothetical protein